jgi:hypothetical protein
LHPNYVTAFRAFFTVGRFLWFGWIRGICCRSLQLAEQFIAQFLTHWLRNRSGKRIELAPNFSGAAYTPKESTGLDSGRRSPPASRSARSA